MKNPTLNWLLEPKDPSIRQQALIDLIHRRKDGKDVTATTEKIQATGLSKKSSPPRQAEASSLPKRPVIVQSGRRPFGPSHSWEEMEAPSDPGISSECERFLELHQTETG